MLRTAPETHRLIPAKQQIAQLIQKGGTAVLMSHLGRPKGKDPELSLIHIVKTVEAVLEKPVLFTDQVVGEKTTEIVKNSKPGQIVLIENLRYYPQEEEGNNSFAKELSKLCLLYTSQSPRDAHESRMPSSA